MADTSLRKLNVNDGSAINNSADSSPSNCGQNTPQSNFNPHLSKKRITILKRPKNRPDDSSCVHSNRTEIDCNAAAIFVKNVSSPDAVQDETTASKINTGSVNSYQESSGREMGDFTTNCGVTANIPINCDNSEAILTNFDHTSKNSEMLDSLTESKFPNRDDSNNSGNFEYDKSTEVTVIRKLPHHDNESSTLASRPKDTEMISLEESKAPPKSGELGSSCEGKTDALETKMINNNAHDELYTGGASSMDSKPPAKSCNDNAADSPKRKLPDLPADLGPLKARCTTMSQEVLQLLSQKIKEDIVKTKDAKDTVRTQQLRELSWKVTDMLALGSSAVKEFETKSAYQLQRERESKKYKNKRNRKWNQPQNDYYENNSSENISNQFPRSDQWRQQNRGGRRGRRGRRDYNDRSNCNSDQDPNWRMPKFNARTAKNFANSFVKEIISKAVNQFLAEEEERAKNQMDREISLAVQLVDSIIDKSIQSLVVESTMVKNNLSLTEAELLCDMCEESISEEESFLMNVEESISIKKEPTLGC